MKTLIHCSMAVFSPRLHVMLSVAQEKIDEGHAVVYVDCEGCLPACAPNILKKRAICKYCVARSRKGYHLIRGGVERRKISDYLDPQQIEALEHSKDDFRSIEELRAVEYHGADVGYAALSSYVFTSREITPDLSRDDIRAALQRLINTGKIVWEAYARILRVERPDRVALFNGRLAADRAVLRACREAGVDCDVYEVTRKDDCVTVFHNALPHDIAYNVRRNEELWESAPPSRVEVAESFYEDRRKGRFTNDTVYTDQQAAGKMPSGWDRSRKHIVIFNSSEDEFVAIGPEWEQNVYPSQVAGIARIAEDLADGENVQVVLRIHPNLKDVDKAHVHALEALADRFPNLLVIPAASDVCSYALLDHADTVVTFGSTMGLEAVYWGKPSVLVGNCFHKPLGATYNPESHEEVVRLLRRDLEPKDRTPALVFAYAKMRSGFKQPYYEGDRREGCSRGYSFRGDRIRVGGLTRMRYKLVKSWRSTRI